MTELTAEQQDILQQIIQSTVILHSGINSQREDFDTIIIRDAAGVTSPAHCSFHINLRDELTHRNDLLITAEKLGIPWHIIANAVANAGKREA